MTRPIVGFLAEFAPVARPADVAHLSASERARHEAGLAATGLAAARAQGEAEGRRLAAAEAAAAREALAAEHEGLLTAARARWAAGEGTALADGLRAGLAALEARLAGEVAAVLEPLVAPALRVRMVDDLRRTLAQLAAGGGGAAIAAIAPADIAEALREALGATASITVADGDEVLVVAGDTTIRSAAAAWAAAFRQALGDAP